jgi:hypothetical protein
MRAFRVMALAAAAALVLAGCAESRVDNGADSRFVGQWLLVSAADARGAIPLSDTYVTLTINMDTLATGRAPCSDYRASIIGQPGVVFVEVTQRNVKGCAHAGLVEVDSRYLAALTATTVASLGPTALTFRSPSDSLTFRRSPLVKIGRFVDIVWSARREMFAASDGETGFDAIPSGGLLLSHDGQFTLEVGQCPSVTGRWVTDVGEILLQNLRHSESQCITPDDTRNRTDMLLALENGFRLTVAGNTMTATNPRTSESIAFVAPMRLNG